MHADGYVFMHASMYVRIPVWLYICVVRVRMCSCVPVYASVDIVSRITVTDCMLYCVSAKPDGQFVLIDFVFLRSLQDDKVNGIVAK